MIKACLTSSRLVKGGEIFTIACPELALSVSDRIPSCALCREIMDKFPERGEETLEVYRGEVLSFTTPPIHKWAEKTYSEDSHDGIRIRTFKQAG